MSASRVAARYAKAYVEALSENKNLEEVAAFQDFCQFVFNNQELVSLFANVTVGAQDKADIVNTLCEKLSVPLYTTRFLAILAENGRLNIIKEISQAITARVDEKKGVQAIKLTSSAPPSAEHLELFEMKMGELLGGRVRVMTAMDPAILGGAIAQVGSIVYDGSVRGQLDRLRKELVKEN